MGPHSRRTSSSRVKVAMLRTRIERSKMKTGRHRMPPCLPAPMVFSLSVCKVAYNRTAMQPEDVLAVEIRPWSSEDLDMLGRIFSDARIMEFLGPVETAEQ